MTTGVLQVLTGLQRQRCKSSDKKCLQINAWELLVVRFFLKKIPSSQQTSVCFQMDNKAVIWCLQHQRSSWLGILLAISNAIFGLVHSHQIHITMQHLLRSQNIWTNTMSQFAKSSVKGHLCRTDSSVQLSRHRCVCTSPITLLPPLTD